jgi:hypothetical protein
MKMRQLFRGERGRERVRETKVREGRKKEKAVGCRGREGKRGRYKSGEM